MKTKMMNLDEYIMRDMMLRIEHGEFPAGTRLPTERQLAAGYSVQRMTARAALERLVLRGYVVVHPRDGYYVAPPRVRIWLAQKMDFLREFLIDKVDWTEARVECVPGTEKIAARTFLSPDRPIVILTRRGILRGNSVALERWFFPMEADGDPDVLPVDLWILLDGAPCRKPKKVSCRETVSIRRAVRSTCQLDITFASERVARKLGLPTHAPLYHACVRGYAGDGGVACFREILMRMDCFEFESHTLREGRETK